MWLFHISHTWYNTAGWGVKPHTGVSGFSFIYLNLFTWDLCDDTNTFGVKETPEHANFPVGPGSCVFYNNYSYWCCYVTCSQSAQTWGRFKRYLSSYHWSRQDTSSSNSVWVSPDAQCADNNRKDYWGKNVTKTSCFLITRLSLNR